MGRVVLVDSHASGEAIAKLEAAHRQEGLLGVKFETPDSLLRKLWSLYGDGRKIVSSLERAMLMRAALDEFDSLKRLSSSGFVDFAARAARVSCGLAAFDDACERACAGETGALVGLAEGELSLLELIGAYTLKLDEFGLVEGGNAACELATRSDEVFPQPLDIEIACDRDLPPQLIALLDGAHNAHATYVKRAYDASERGLSRAPDGIKLGFAFPSGGYATPALAARLVRSLKADGMTAISCSDPLKLYKAICGPLAQDGLHVAARGSVSLADTLIGRMAYELSMALFKEGGMDRGAIASSALKCALTDAAASPYCRLSSANVLMIDKALRADRLMKVGEAIKVATDANEMLAACITYVISPRDDVGALSTLKRTAMSLNRLDACERDIELSAIGCLECVTEVAKHTGAGSWTLLSALASMGIGVSCSNFEGRIEPDVFIGSLSDVSSLEPSALASVVALDLTNDAYPISRADDSLSTLHGKLGLQVKADPLALARLEFERLSHMPSKNLIMSRPLNDEKTEPTYPSAMFQEFVDCYRADPTDTSDLDDDLGIPRNFAANALLLGEERLFQNAVASESSMQVGSCVISLESHSMDSKLVERLVGFEGGKPVLSPSAIEAYLQCPRKWLYSRAAKADSIDEDFSQREKGIFCHTVLERFINTLKATGVSKANAATLKKSEEAMWCSIEAVRGEQAGERPLSSSRLVPVNHLESAEVESLSAELMRWPKREADLLPSFAPAFIEAKIAAEDCIEYAGCIVVGKADRLDTCGSEFCVIDYKGSCTKEYDAFDSSGEPSQKRVQALIYASAFASKLNMRPVSAIYASYKRSADVHGAYEALALDDSEIPGIDGERCACSLDGKMSFDELLAYTQGHVSSAIERMLAGDVAPCPADASACRYCPASPCEGRLAAYGA